MYIHLYIYIYSSLKKIPVSPYESFPYMGFEFWTSAFQLVPTQLQLVLIRGTIGKWPISLHETRNMGCGSPKAATLTPTCGCLER